MEKKDKFALLREPFPAKDIEWRIQRAGVTRGKGWGMVLAYVTNRAIQERLDDIIGPDNWKNEYSPAPGGGILCGISIKCDNEWVTKYDGAENTAVEAVKGGLSSSMKRTAVQWGIGRYLYKLDTTFINMQEDKPQDMTGWYMHYDKETKSRFYWKAPRLPEWALPKGETLSEPF